MADSSDDSGEKTAVLQADQDVLKKELQKAKEQQACLIIIRGTPQGQRFFITHDEMTVGRDPSAQISVSDQSISRKHAKLTRKGSEVMLTDLGSANGTLVNDKKLDAGTTVVLAKEDMIKMGNSIFKFLPAGELEILFYGNLGDAAHLDALTQIYNKGYLLEALEAEFKRAKALHSEFAAIYFDLDHFKKVNDTHGHDAGDYVLKEFTRLVKASHVRQKDIFARFGGEEFVMLLAHTNAKDASAIAERIRAAVEAYPFIYEGKRIPVTTSLGVAELKKEMDAPQALLKTADKALYSAKQSGRNRVIVAP